MKTILPLTEAKLRNLQPKTNLYKVFDSGGLYIEVTPHNTKTWRLKYTLNGKDKRHTFGRYPEINLKMARELAKNFKILLDNGELLPQNTKKEIVTVRKISTLFLEKTQNTITQKAPEEDGQYRKVRQTARKAIFGLNQGVFKR